MYITAILDKTAQAHNSAQTKKKQKQTPTFFLVNLIQISHTTMQLQAPIRGKI